jgi:hypothetical protein
MSTEDNSPNISLQIIRARSASPTWPVQLRRREKKKKKKNHLAVQSEFDRRGVKTPKTEVRRRVCLLFALFPS